MNRALFCLAVLLMAEFAHGQTAAILQKYCVGCHQGGPAAGNLDLSKWIGAPVDGASRGVWEKVERRLSSGQMPPAGAPRPAAEDRNATVAWVRVELAKLDAAVGENPGRVTARRLNRAEYRNTIRDLLGVEFDAERLLPADASGYGFDNIGDVLSVTPALLEKYLEAAHRIAKMAIPENTAPSSRRVRYTEADANGRIVVTPEGGMSARILVPAEGDYSLKVSVGGRRTPATPPFRVTLKIDGKDAGGFESIGGVEPPIALRNDMEIAWRPSYGEHLLEAFYEELPLPQGAPKLDLNAIYKGLPGSPTHVSTFELTGPANAVAPPPPASYRNLFVCGHGYGKHERECARRAAAAFARRAFRHPVTENEVSALAAFAGRAAQEGVPWDYALRDMVKAALVSPHFLFLIERDAADAKQAARELNDHELASRLSYFLWSTMPDAELFALADGGRLRDPVVLGAQVRRMLASNRTAELVGNFGGQWLEFRNLDLIKPDPERFPRFTPDLRAAMMTETRMFFGEMIAKDRSVLDFIDAPFTYLNETLAKHYGIAGVKGPRFRRVELKDKRRAGIVTQASLMTVSSYPTRTSPVLRGKYILENFLNAPPPAPPPDVPNLDEGKVGKAGSLRQQLERHRTNAACSGCHASMDPLGFALENYDAIGAWRTHDGAFEIDDAAELPDGAKVRGAEELRAHLRAHPQEFAHCIAEKMLIYALGRGLEAGDRAAVNRIVRAMEENDYRFSVLVSEIAASVPFRMRANREGPPQ